MKNFFNTTLGLSMLPDGDVAIQTVSDEDAAEFLKGPDVLNVANPAHANSLQAITQKLGVDVRDAKGGRVSLVFGDRCLVVEISGIPRETREFSDEEVAAAVFKFRIVSMK